MFQACGCLPVFSPFSVSSDKGESNTEQCFQAVLWIQGLEIFVTNKSSQYILNICWELLFIYREDRGHTNLLLFLMGKLHRKRKLPASRAQCISWTTDIHTMSPNWFVVRLNIRTKHLISVGIGDKTVEPQPHFTTSIGLQYKDNLNSIFPPPPKYTLQTRNQSNSFPRHKNRTLV